MIYEEVYVCANGVQLKHTYSDTYFILNEDDVEYYDAYDPIDTTHTYRENLNRRLDDERGEDDV